MDELAAAAAVLAVAHDSDSEEDMANEQRPMETASTEGGATSFTSIQVRCMLQPHW